MAHINTKWCNGFYIEFRQSFAKETFSYDEQLKSQNIQYCKPEVRERKKMGVHGTLKMTYMGVKFNFQQVLIKTLIPTMNTLTDMAVLNIMKTDGKCAPEAKRQNLELIRSNR